MANKPIDGGAYYLDATGKLVKLEEGKYELDSVTRELKAQFLQPPAPSAPEPKAEQPASKTTNK